MSCSHPEPVDVESVADELVAKLCLACDEQLPADFDPRAVPPIRLKTVLG